MIGGSLVPIKIARKAIRRPWPPLAETESIGDRETISGAMIF